METLNNPAHCPNQVPQTGDYIEAHVTAQTSFYRQVKGTVVELRNDYIYIIADIVMSKYGTQYKPHPTSCLMGIKPENLMNITSS